MLEFADAKRVIDKAKMHEGSTAFADLYLELFAMLEESTAETILKYQNDVKDLKCQLIDKEVELVKANEAIEALQNTNDQLRRDVVALNEKAVPKPRRGRPPKKNKETFGTDLEDLGEKFGVHELAVELANMKED